ncbi:MAG: site-specific integrase [Catenulispora sp. 13_1_20CM_3_70_7]|nr:MAG: site-specific integrase [Catenulispora sp. 13_1_20CM_3_70_7]
MTDNTTEPDSSKKTRGRRGDGGLYWSEKRQRWIAEATVGYAPSGKRVVKKASGRTKTEAKNKLKEILRDLYDGTVTNSPNYTVADAVGDWLAYGLPKRGRATIERYRIMANVHVVPSLGGRKLRELSADDVDRWLAEKAKTVSTSYLADLHSMLRRVVGRAQARDKVKRNVVLLCGIPQGQPGRKSKALTYAQAEALLTAAEGRRLYAYVVLSLLVGARTEELRGLTWNHVDLDGRPDADPPVPPSIMVWRSVREGGDTKTKKSRRTLALPKRCVDALKAHREAQRLEREAAGDKWQEHGLVFASLVGTEQDAHNVRRQFRDILKRAELDPNAWTPRELRHSFVSLLSDAGMPTERISLLVGHNGTAVTEVVYRHQLRPVLQDGAQMMDQIFPDEGKSAAPDPGSGEVDTDRPSPPD